MFIKGNKKYRIYKKLCAIVSIVTFLVSTMPIRALAASSTNYRLGAFTMDTAGGSGLSSSYDLTQNSFGETIVGDAQSANVKVRGGFLSSLDDSDISPPPPPPNTDYLASSANFRQTSHVLNIFGADMQSAGFRLPLVSVGEVMAGISANYVTDGFLGQLYTIADSPPSFLKYIPSQIWPVNTDKIDAFDLDDYFVDPDGDALTFLVSGQANITVTVDSASHLVSFFPNTGFIGSEVIIITAVDSNGQQTASAPISLNVYNPVMGINNAPVLEYIGDITLSEGELVDINPQSTDPDGDALTYTFNAPLDNQGQWQTNYQNAGTYAITVTVSDGTLTDSQNVVMTILDRNRAPVLDFIGNIDGQEDAIITISPTATDPDEDNLSYSFGAPFDSQGQWRPGYSDAGVYTVKVTVLDGGLSDFQDVLVTVDNVNTVPTMMVSLDAINVAVNEDVSFMVKVRDEDGDRLDLTLQKDGTTFYTGGVYDFHLATASFASVGTHTLTAIVDDNNGGQIQRTVNVEVINAKDLWNKILPLLGDFNGDGLADIGTYNKTTGRWAVALSNIDGFGSVTEWLSNFGATTDWQYVNGDFNGDGKTDIAILNQSNGQCQVAVSSAAGFVNQGTWVTFSGFSSNSIPVTGDFNGDGVSDVGFYNKSNGDVTIALSNKNNFSAPTVWKYGMSYSSTASPFSGDFNGDGLSDLGVFNNGQWSFAVSTGRNLFGKPDWNQSFGSGQRPLITDFNNDGLTDIGVFYKDTGRWQRYHATGNGFVAAGDWVTNFAQGEYTTPYALDFNGDGLTDAAAFDNATFRWQRLFAQGDVPDLLKKITNSLGGTNEITYKSSVNYNNTGTDDQSDLPFAIQTIATVTKGDGMGNFYSTNYSYADGRYDAQTREMRGFGYVKVTDPKGNISETWFKQDDIFKGMPFETRVSDALGNLYRKTLKTYDYTAPYAGAKFVFLLEEEGFVYDGQLTPRIVKSMYEYDNYGNPTKIISQGDVDIIGDETTNVTEYTYNTTDWLLSYPKHTVLLDDQLNTVSEQWFYYDQNLSIDDVPTKGFLSKKEDWLYNPLTGTTQRISTSYMYDPYGNLISITDSLGRNTTTQYDSALKIYPEIVTNDLGRSVNMTYDIRTGQILITVDSNNQTSRKEYDVFGRVIKVFGFNDDATHPSRWYEYDVFSLPARIITYTREINNTDDANKIRTSYAFVDGVGRTIQTRVESDDLTQQIVSGGVVLNQRGLAKESYLPYIEANSSSYSAPNLSGSKITYQYDALGRVTLQTNADLTYKTMSYAPDMVSGVDENGHKMNKYSDVFGRIVKVEEFNNGRIYTTRYEYDTTGNLLKTIDDQGNVIDIMYDSLGRKIAMNDPDMGQWEYEYDVLGNLVKQVDGKGRILRFQYDRLNRLIKKSEDVGGVLNDLAVYDYDEVTKTYCVGRLSKVTYPLGSTEFFYDNVGREIKSVKTVEGAAHTVERAYDAMSRLTSLTYPDGEIVNYTYQISGGIQSVVGNQTYVADMTYTIYGQIENMTYGNSTFIDYEYDPITLRLFHLSTNNGTLQDLRYQFDNGGNITTITDNRYGATQSFGYDDLNRLTSAIGTNYGTKNYKYDSIGNILEKDNKTYIYGENSAGPHAVTSLDNGTSTTNIAYDQNGNMTAKGGTTFDYDVENRLTKVIGAIKQPVNTTFDITLQPGWNHISLPLIPEDNTINAIFAGLNFGVDYDQVSQYDPTQADFDNYNNTSYNEFTTMQYGKGYTVYVTNPTTLNLSITGKENASVLNYVLKTGWNLIGTPSTTPIKVSDALSSLTYNTDYTRITKYNSTTGGYDDLLQTDILEPGKAYYLYCPQDIVWNITPTAKITTAFTYDGDGGRVQKTITDAADNILGTTMYIGSLYEEQTVNTQTTRTKHIYAGSTYVATVATNGQQSTTNFYHSDHLGSSNIITDESGQVIQQLEYLPFGAINQNTGTDTVTRKFTGQELDTATGLYYYGARYYDPELGRFITSDTIVQSPGSPQTFNRYAYVGNNPIMRTDPTGHFWFIPFIVAAIKGAMIGAAMGAASAAVMGGDIGKGALFGAIGGAVFAGMGSLAQSFTRFATVPGGIGPMVKGASLFANRVGGVLAGAGAGAAMAGAGGQDVGEGALTGAISAGFSKFGGNLFNGNDFLAFSGNTLSRAIIGGAAGGLAHTAMGESFEDGFRKGAFNAAISYSVGDWLQDKGLKWFYKTAGAFGRGVNPIKIGQFKKTADANEMKFGVQQAHQGQAIAYHDYVGDGSIAGFYRIFGEMGQIVEYTGKTVRALTTGQQIRPDLNTFTLDYYKDAVNDVYVTYKGEFNELE